MVVGPGVNITSLTRQQIIDIFSTGKLKMRTSAIAFQLDTVPNVEENQRIEAPNPRNNFRSLPPLEPPRRFSVSEEPHLR
jgi:hypothetical protein